MAESPLPLEGITVLEFTHAVMGPAAGLILADLGAEVIRIEPAPDGDRTRRLKGFGAGYHTFFNRNKKSLPVDLKHDDGRRLVEALVDRADVLIENFAPGTIERLGFGYEAVSARNPRLIYCRLKGFMAGPYERRTALDEVVQMMTGLAYMTGPPGMPLRAGASVVDILGGTFGALGVLVALRERDASGRGRLVETGLFESAAYLMGQHMAYGAVAGVEVPPMPSRISPWSVYRLFETADGEQIFIGIISDRHWQRFCEAFELPDLAADEHLATNNQRVAARDHFHPRLETLLAGMPLDEITARCERAGIPFAPIARPEALFDDPQLNQGGSLAEVTLPDGGRTRLPRLPLALDGARPPLRVQPPRVGEHTREILAALGLDPDRIEALGEAGVVVLNGGSTERPEEEEA